MQKYAADPSPATTSRVSKGFKDDLGIESIFVCLEILPISLVVRVKAAAEGQSDARYRSKRRKATTLFPLPLLVLGVLRAKNQENKY